MGAGEIFRIKNKWIGAKFGQNPRGKPGSVCFTPDTVNNKKYKAKSTLELLTKKIVYIPEWLSYSYIYLKIYGKT